MRLIVWFSLCLWCAMCFGGCSSTDVRCDERLLPINPPKGIASNANHGAAAVGSPEKTP
jgi:hypothetical protein